MSKRALKHFVESRKRQNLSIVYMNFIIEHIQETLSSPNMMVYKSTQQVYFSKDYHHKGKPCVRIILDICKDNRLEICSMHFQKKL